MESLPAIYLIIQLLCVIGVFAFLAYASEYIVNKVKSSPGFKNSKFLNPMEYFPQEKILSLKQLYYLIMILVFIVISLYIIFEWTDGLFAISILDIIISIYLFSNMGWNSLKDKIIFFLLIPIGSMIRILFGHNILIYFNIIHVLGYVYLIQVYYRKFVKYTENNGLGITILLLYTIILVSFIFTIIVEEVSPLDSIVMVSNAFTSNSFDAAGKSVIGKLDSLVLAWGGFILSGVGTATLAASIVNRYVDRQFDDMKDFIKNNKKDNK